MSHRSSIFWTRLMAVTFVTTGQLLHADTPPATTSDYKMVPIKTSNGHTTYIKVKKQTDPFSSLPLSEQKTFSQTSSFASKSFLADAQSLSKNGSNFNHDQDTFITKSYTGDGASPTAPNLNAKAILPTTSASDFGQNAKGFDKSFSTSSADMGQSRTVAFASSASTSADQNRTAILNGKKINPTTSTLAEKTFQGSEADAIHRHLTKTDDGRVFISDLPNRALTIDEVRNLINHGFKPDTNVKPAEPSKPLNDPDYKPEPLRDDPSPPSSSSAPGEDDKNDPVPPPGTMAATPPPENSEPLPQP